MALNTRVSGLDDDASAAASLVDGFEKAMQSGAVGVGTLMRYADGLRELGLFDLERDAIEAAILIEPDNADLFFRRGASYSYDLAMALLNDDGWEEIARPALKSFERAIELDPTHVPAIYNAVECILLSSPERIREAIELSRRWRALVDGEVVQEGDAEFKLALAYLMDERFDEASELLSRLIEKMPRMPECYFARGVLALKSGSTKVAEYIRPLEEMDPVLARALINLSQLRNINYREIAICLLTIEDHAS